MASETTWSGRMWRHTGVYTVISAAHCTIGSSAENWRVSVGHIASSSRPASCEDGYQEREIKFLQTHPKYSPRRYPSGDPNENSHDISIMVTETPFEYTDYVRPACLPSPGFKIEHEANCVISGW